MTKKLSEMNEDEKKALGKKLWSRCYMRKKNELKRKPTKEEVQDCIKGEIYKIEHGLVEKRKGRPTSEEEFFDVMKESIPDDDFSPMRQREREEFEDVATVRKINESLAEWGSGNPPPPSREASMKRASEILNEEIRIQTDKNICPTCLSSVCRCPQDKGGEDEHE